MITATSAFLTANAALAKQPVFLVEIESYGKVFGTIPGAGGTSAKAWIKSIAELDQSLDELNGSSTLSEFAISIVDYNLGITGDFPTFQFEGKVVTLKAGFPGLAESDFITLFVGYVDTVVSNDDGITYDFNCIDKNRLNQQVIYLLGDDGNPTDSDNPHSLLANPMDILYDILLNEVGFALSEIDTTKIYAYRDSLFAGMLCSFNITSPPVALDFIQTELLQAFGGYLYVDNLGRITVDFLQPIPGPIVPTFTFTPDDLTVVPLWDQLALVNTISYLFDYDETGSGGFVAEAVNMASESVDRFGQQGQTEIDSHGVRSGYQGYALATMVCRSIFARYADKNPTLDLTAFWDSILVTIGDFIYVTHPLVPNRATGTRGITNMLFQVMAKKINFAAGTVEFTVNDCSKVQAFGFARLAPDGTPSWTGASSYQKGRYLFITDTSGKQSDGAQGGVFV